MLASSRYPRVIVTKPAFCSAAQQYRVGFGRLWLVEGYRPAIEAEANSLGLVAVVAAVVVTYSEAVQSRVCSWLSLYAHIDVYIQKYNSII